jgi:ABC-type multidrug transport system ATPase subunit
LQSGSVRATAGTTVAFTAHEPWIINATARENILLASGVGESAKPEAAYEEAVHACALVEDFNSWVDGDGTLIGEKGINVSGGQRQRISICRALCSDAQVFMMDAPMSGLDAVVANHVFNNAILKAAQTRLVIMTDCTFKPGVLSASSRLILLDQGRIVFDGVFEDAATSGLLSTVSASAVTAEETQNTKLPTSNVPDQKPSAKLQSKTLNDRNKKVDDINKKVRASCLSLKVFFCEHRFFFSLLPAFSRNATQTSTSNTSCSAAGGTLLLLFLSRLQLIVWGHFVIFRWLTGLMELTPTKNSCQFTLVLRVW